MVDLGAHAPFHNALRIETSSPDFIEWVQVEASDDGHVWRMVQERAPIFRFRKDNHQGTQVVHYSENNAQYLRVRILDGDAKFPVERRKCLARSGGTRGARSDGYYLIAGREPAGRAQRLERGRGSDCRARERSAVCVASPAEFIRSVQCILECRRQGLVRNLQR